MKKNCELGQKNIFCFFSFMNPSYEPILVFPKFDPLPASGLALCVDFGVGAQGLYMITQDL
jgi:hypothetical protein